MIAITPPIIASKEVAQKQATLLPRRDLLTARNRFRPNFRGWRLDEFSIFARPPPPGGPPTPTFAAGAAASRTALAAALCRSRCTPSRRRAFNCARKVYQLNSRWLAGKVYPHEISFQETRTNHRKLDSQARRVK